MECNDGTGLARAKCNNIKPNPKILELEINLL